MRTDIHIIFFIFLLLLLLLFFFFQYEKRAKRTTATPPSNDGLRLMCPIGSLCIHHLHNRSGNGWAEHKWRARAEQQKKKKHCVYYTEERKIVYENGNFFLFIYTFNKYLYKILAGKNSSHRITRRAAKHILIHSYTHTITYSHLQTPEANVRCAQQRSEERKKERARRNHRTRAQKRRKRFIEIFVLILYFRFNIA